MIKLEHNGSLYSFDRDNLGRGDWVILKGKCPGLIGGSTPNVIVPLSYAKELTQLAIQNGLGSPDKFAPTITKLKAKPVSLSVRKKVVKIKGLFNPFKTLFSKTEASEDEDFEVEESESDDPEYSVVGEFKELELES